MDARTDIIVELKNVDAEYNGILVLEKINLRIYKNDFIGVIGPNGGGKTTLVKLILRLLKQNTGEIITRQSGKAETTIGYLPQVHTLDKKFPISVKDVVLSGLISKQNLTGSSKKHELERAQSIMSKMQIEELHNKAIGELSGGQMQRVFLCRSIISSPQLLILDEPNTYVDNQFEGELYEMLKTLNENMAIIIVSHDIGMISSYVKSIACVNRNLHYHPSNIISPEQLKAYNCPIQLITHGDVPHTVLHTHNH